MITVSTKPLAGAEPGTPVPFEASADRPRLPDVPGIGRLKVSGTLSRLDGGYLVKGTLHSSVRLECARCLKPFDHPLSLRFSEQFSLEPTDEQFPAGTDRIELDPMLRAVVLTHLPERPLHDPACKGLCPVCGKDLGEEPHTHPDPDPDPGPFDQLKKLR